MASPSTRYPLPSWPREAYPFEPAHGYFRRLAAANAQVSVRTLGSYVGVNGRNFDREELLEFCSRFPSKGIENLQRSTPQIEGSLVIMNGEIISRTKDYTPYHPKACASCLRASYHYRNWFDLSAVRFCPIHEAPLCDLNTGERMAWWQADLGHPASLSRSEDRFSYDHRSLEWARYVLGRMGVVDRCPSIVLDALPLVDVIAGCVLLGTGALRLLLRTFCIAMRPPKGLGCCARRSMRFSLTSILSPTPDWRDQVPAPTCLSVRRFEHLSNLSSIGRSWSINLAWPSMNSANGRIGRQGRWRSL